MAQFAYRARDRRGQMVSGVVSGKDQEEVVQQLRRGGLTVLSTTLRSAGGGGLNTLRRYQFGKPRVKQGDIVYFATQLAVMVDTGVPLAEALDAIVQQTENTTLREVLTKVAEDVEAGQPFSESLEKHPKYFNNMFVSLVRAGESSGNLGHMLTGVAEYLVESQETKRRVKGALAYPAFMLCLAAVVVVVLLTFVLPKFTKIYDNKGAVLPTPTRILLGLSGFFTTHWLPVIIAVVVLTTGAILFFRHRSGQRALDILKIRLPIIGGVSVKYYTAHAFKALGLMISAGVPVLTALEIARKTTTNHRFGEIFDRAVEKVSEGETLSDQFFCSALVPVTTSQMIFAGEKAGRLGDVLLRVSEFCDRELKAAIKSMTTLLEPLLIAFMGLVVGGIAISLLLPMFTIGRVMAK